MATKKKSTARPGRNAAGRQQAIRIRMYRIGFGDCFLLTLPAADQDRHILIDCGVHSQGDIRVKGPAGEKSLISSAVEDIRKESGGHLALVIATHAHQDHISGFSPAAFAGFTVDEVWMPWTEDPSDRQAVRLRTKQTALVAQLAAHFAAAPASHEAMAAVANLTENATALKLLRSGFGTGKVRYFAAGESLEDAAGIKGLSATLLGPPRDEKFLSRMDPPAGQRYLQAAAGSVTEVNKAEPFPSKWVDGGDRPPDLKVTEAFAGKLKQMTDGSAESLAFALDHVRNNTSLVVLFTYRGEHLLFAGDAQYGNWSSWIYGAHADDLLGQLSFYKTSHHGSFNATPKEALNKMPQDGFAAMVSTQSSPWASIPLPALMKTLAQRTGNRVARSDSVRVIAVNDVPKPPDDQLPSCFRAGDFWIDYSIGVR